MKRTLLLMVLLSITSITFSQTNGQVKEQQKIEKEKKMQNREGGIWNYVDEKTAETLELSKEYTDLAKEEAITESNAYTDQEKADAINQLKAYTDQAKTDAITQSNAYTDQAKTDAITESNAYTDQEKVDAINQAVTNSNSYTDTKLEEKIGPEFTWDGNGIGIGTETVGSFKLAVEGKIGAHEIVLSTDGWADFVFESNYRLMPLNELDTYIQENKHLPEIPTTTEVEKEGISVGEMNAKLLQKIEELTLHTIQQQELIETLKQGMEAQNKRLEQLENK